MDEPVKKIVIECDHIRLLCLVAMVSALTSMLVALLCILAFSR